MGRADIVPAIMPNTAAHLDEMAQMIAAFAHSAQIDVMDSTFSSAVSWPYGSGQMKELERMHRIPGSAQLAYEVHLMVADPEHIGVLFAQRGARRIIAQVETLGHANDALRIFGAWRSAGAEVGISLLLDTPISEISGVIPDVDVVQVMSIAEIGYQGHPFDERAIERVRTLRKQYLELTISVDGGVSKENAGELVDAGANRLCIGSAILKAADPEQAYAEIAQAATGK